MHTNNSFLRVSKKIQILLLTAFFRISIAEHTEKKNSKYQLLFLRINYADKNYFRFTFEYSSGGEGRTRSLILRPQFRKHRDREEKW
jgi:hypothetical protein